MKIEILPSKKNIFSKDNQSILESAIASQLTLGYSCKNGECGICKAKLISGQVKKIGSSSFELTAENEILTCCSIPVSDISIECDYIPELEDIKIQTIPVKVNSISTLSDEVIEISFRYPPSIKFDFLSGQYIDLIWNGVKRSYSIASKNSEDELVIQVKKVQGGLFSALFFNELKLNQLFRVNGPLGTFFCRKNRFDKVFLCTGTGFAPVRSMVETLIAEGDRFNIYIFWGGRQPTDLYSDLPIKWSRAYANVEFQPVYSRCVDNEEAFHGYVQDALIASGINLENIEVYACGSSSMIDSAKNLLIESGLSEKRFYSDAFLASS